ncbi:MAG: TVP38/TMEM64 family protein [Desulfobaccales bacterium]
MPEPITENSARDNGFQGTVPWLRPLIFLLVLAVLLIIGRALHLQEYLQEDRLGRLIASCGIWGPLVYLLIWAIAPSLFIPALPLVVAGGILFGPVGGVVYSILGASAGSSLAFLVSRYLARDWVAAKISGSKLAHLDDLVGRHGWKIVAFTRLVIVLPFFLLNYAFGLTRVGFWPYALATLFALLPSITATVLVSSNLLGLLRGQVSIWLLLGILLLAVVGLLPLIYRRVKAQQGESVEL